MLETGLCHVTADIPSHIAALTSSRTVFKESKFGFIMAYVLSDAIWSSSALFTLVPTPMTRISAFCCFSKSACSTVLLKSEGDSSVTRIT